MLFAKMLSDSHARRSFCVRLLFVAMNPHNHQGQEHLCRRSAICWASAMLQSLLHLKATQLQHMPRLQMLTQNTSSKMKSAESPRRKRGVGSMAANAKYLTATRTFSWLASCAREQRCKPGSKSRLPNRFTRSCPVLSCWRTPREC